MKFSTLGLALAIIGTASLVQAAPMLNIDFGGGKGTPLDSYGAASGQTGHWNTISELGLTTGLLDTAGVVTPTSITTFGTGANGGTGSCPCSEQQSLLSDMFWRTGGAWTVSISGLDNGLYEVFLYAPSHPMPTGSMHINGVFAGSLSGSLDSFDQGVNWSVANSIQVLDHNLHIMSSGTGGYAWSGLAGLQIIKVSEPWTKLSFLLGLSFLAWRKFAERGLHIANSESKNLRYQPFKSSTQLV